MDIELINFSILSAAKYTLSNSKDSIIVTAKTFIIVIKINKHILSKQFFFRNKIVNLCSNIPSKNIPKLATDILNGFLSVTATAIALRKSIIISIK